MKRFAPAAERNRQPILDVLRDELPAQGTVLEVGSGSGQHVVYFAQTFPHLHWQPSDLDPIALDSIAAWVDEAGLDNIAPPVRLDAAASPWPITRAEGIISINMIHIAPWTAAQGLMTGAGQVLSSGGLLFVYGPFRISGRPTAPSNEAFDQALRAQEPSWGLRYLHELEAEANDHGLRLVRVHDMPANNIAAVFHREPLPGANSDR